MRGNEGEGEGGREKWNNREIEGGRNRKRDRGRSGGKGRGREGEDRPTNTDRSQALNFPYVHTT